MNKPLLERGKSLLIVLLLLSAALLIRASGYFPALGEGYLSASQGSLGQSGQSSAETSASAVTVRPVAVVISGEEGTRCALEYDGDAVSAAFDSFSAALGEAIGSSSAIESVSEQLWQQSISECGVTFDFYYPQPLSLLSQWLGTTAGAAGEHSARYMCISCTGSNAWFYFRSESDGTYYRCATALSSQAVTQRMELYRRNNAVFAFESERYSGVEPYTVMLDELPAVYAVYSDSAQGNMDLNSIMSLLGMNSYVIRPYTEADGTQVYVENGKTLRVGADGSISFKAPAPTSGETGTELEAAQAASALVGEIMQGHTGDAELHFAGGSFSDGKYTAKFEYAVDGVPVEQSSGVTAASVTIENGEVRSLELVPRRYTLTEEEQSVLPMLLASAIAASGSGELRLVYIDSGSAVNCAWVTG
jgi:hypothetical protein